MTTEAEAKTKWCPMARTIPATIIDGIAYQGSIKVPAHNRIQENEKGEATWHESHHCIGSACQFWRWDAVQAYIEIDPASYQHNYRGSGGGPGVGMPVETSERSKTDGYCGMAGKP